MAALPLAASRAASRSQISTCLLQQTWPVEPCPVPDEQPGSLSKGRGCMPNNGMLRDVHDNDDDVIFGWCAALGTVHLRLPTPSLTPPATNRIECRASGAIDRNRLSGTSRRRRPQSPALYNRRGKAARADDGGKRPTGRGKKASSNVVGFTIPSSHRLAGSP